jgi:hypothetical protein
MYTTNQLNEFIQESSRQIKNYTNVKNYISVQNDISDDVIGNIIQSIDSDIQKRKIQIEVFQNILNNIDGLRQDPMLDSEIGNLIITKLPDHIQGHALKLLNGL